MLSNAINGRSLRNKQFTSLATVSIGNPSIDILLYIESRFYWTHTLSTMKILFNKGQNCNADWSICTSLCRLTVLSLTTNNELYVRTECGQNCRTFVCSLLSLFWKIKVGLWEHVALRVCVSVYSLIVARKRLDKTPPIIARQRLGRNVTAVTNTHATIEKLLDALFSMWSVSY
jgi:hypothetical protein